MPFLQRLRKEAELEVFFNSLRRELGKGNNTETRISEALKGDFSRREVTDLLKASAKAGKIRLSEHGTVAMLGAKKHNHE